MIRRENQELATKQDITTHLTEEEATEIYIDQKRDQARNNLRKRNEPGLQRGIHNAHAYFRKWTTPGTRDARHKKWGDSKSALAYLGLTDLIGSAKMAGTLIDFVSIQALEPRASQTAVTRILAYDIGLPV